MNSIEHPGWNFQNWSPKEKIGQLFCLAIPKGLRRASPEMEKLKEQIIQYHIGGLLLFPNTKESAQEVLEELESLQKRENRIPLWISSDMERGLGQILSGGIEFPCNMAISAGKNLDIPYEQGKITAIEARSMGVHSIYAPVCDLSLHSQDPIISTRSYGSDPEWVAQCVEQYIHGLQDHGVLACAKHFPGHGASSIDSHLDLPILDLVLEQLEKREFIPFRSAIQSGVSQIMTAHLAFPKITGKPQPVTLSPLFLQEILRNSMGFDGLIVSDALDMKGIAIAKEKKAKEKNLKTAETGSEQEIQEITLENLALNVLLAGVDLLLCPPDLSRMVSSLLRALDSKELSEERLNQSFLRILQIKGRLGLLEEYKEDEEDEATKQSEFSALERKTSSNIALKTAQNSLTWIGDAKKPFPIQHSLLISIVDEDMQRDKQEDMHENMAKDSVLGAGNLDSGNLSTGKIFVEEIKKRTENFQICRLSKFQEIFQRDSATPLESSGDLLGILAIFSRVRSHKGWSGLSPGTLDSLKSLKGKSLFFLCFASPYIYMDLDEPENFLCMYSGTKVSQIASVQALFGEISVSGILPIRL